MVLALDAALVSVLVLLLIAHTDRFFYPLLAPGRIDRLAY